jgi:hypothetical protein
VIVNLDVVSRGMQEADSLADFPLDALLEIPGAASVL